MVAPLLVLLACAPKAPLRSPARDIALVDATEDVPVPIPFIVLATAPDPSDPPGAWRGFFIDHGPISQMAEEAQMRAKADIDRVIARQMESIRGCYQAALVRQPHLAGKVVIKFTIDTDGLVAEAVVKSSTLGAPDVESCIVEQFDAMIFPQPRGTTIITYPFVFGQE